MFTGLVETIGTVTSLTPTTSTTGTTLTITAPAPILDPTTANGDSISINGTCLTVTSFDLAASTFTVGIAPETLRRTNLGSLQQGSNVNLERAVSAATRMGGHFVQGHVDAVATIASITPDGNALTFRLKLPEESRSLLRYIVEKGYITLDGASLTITAVNDGQGWFEVMLIAYTQTRVVTAAKTAGDGVNVEIDVVGKYVEKSVGAYFEQLAAGEGGTGGAEAPAILEKMVRQLVDERMMQMFAQGEEQPWSRRNGSS